MSLTLPRLHRSRGGYTDAKRRQGGTCRAAVGYCHCSSRLLACDGPLLIGVVTWLLPISVSALSVHRQYLYVCGKTASWHSHRVKKFVASVVFTSSVWVKAAKVRDPLRQRPGSEGSVATLLFPCITNSFNHDELVLATGHCFLVVTAKCRSSLTSAMLCLWSL